MSSRQIVVNRMPSFLWIAVGAFQSDKIVNRNCFCHHALKAFEFAQYVSCIYYPLYALLEFGLIEGNLNEALHIECNLKEQLRLGSCAGLPYSDVVLESQR